MASPVGGLRVLQLGPLYVEHVRRWAENAAALGCEVHVAGHLKQGRAMADFTHLAARVEIGPDGPSEHEDGRHAAWLRDLLGDLRPDIVHAHWLPTWGYYAVQSGHPGVVVTAWGDDVYRLPSELTRRAEAAVRAAPAVIGLSEHMRAMMVADGARPDRVHLVDLGVELDRFRPAAPEERNRLRAELGLGPGPVLLSLRAGTDPYNVDVVIEAFRLLRARQPEAVLILALGDAPLSPAVWAALDTDRAGIRVLDRLPRAEMADYLRVSSVGISIPASDGSPNSVWEALACGLPVVLSDLPQVAGRMGGCPAVRVVAPRPRPVADAAAALIDRDDGMAGAGREWAAANVDRRAQLPRLERLYAAMATGSSPPRAPRAARPVAADRR
jgi:glycosyltransferase involved in cell wall biosynthesis